MSVGLKCRENCSGVKANRLSAARVSLRCLLLSL